MRHRLNRLLVGLSLIVAGRAGAQGAAAQPSSEQLQSANTLFTQSNWQSAFDAYAALAKQFPTHALSRFRVGVALMELGRLPEAEASLREGERLGIPAPQAAFRLAQLFAEQKRGEVAMAELMRSAGAGFFITASALEADRHLGVLKANAKWSAVLDAFDAVIQPCRHDARYREFDFWLGDWDVRPTGQPSTGPAGRNTVTLEDNGCVVTEHWTAPSGSMGQSFNLFDRSIGKWRQTWVDNVGGQHDYRGALKNGNMVLEGDTPAPNGRLGRVPTRLTFFPFSKDSLRQFSQISNDSGRTWQTAYDLTYVRRAGEPHALSDADRGAIRSLDSAFVSSWLVDDTAGVLNVFSRDAALLPPGRPPVTGLVAIKAYWWPTDGSRTRIRAFDRTIDEIGGSRGVAFIRGTASLAWDAVKDGRTTSQTSRSINLTLYEQDSAGRWRVTRQMWSVLP